jgi:NitT/TauT family transport system ATP-binding protein
MSPRPGRIAEIVDVPIGRPRSHDLDGLERSAELRDMTADLWRKLRAFNEELQVADHD